MERVLAQRYTAGVVAAFCRNNQVDPAALPQLVSDVLATWLRLDLPVEAAAPGLPVIKAKRGRPAQHRDGVPSRKTRTAATAAVADTAMPPQAAASPEPHEDMAEQVAPEPQQAAEPDPEPEPVLVQDSAPKPVDPPVSPAAAEDVLPDRDSPEMKRHTVESVFGNFRPARQDDTAPAQGGMPETEPGPARARRTPFSQQSVRRLRS